MQDFIYTKDGNKVELTFFFACVCTCVPRHGVTSENICSTVVSCLFHSCVDPDAYFVPQKIALSGERCDFGRFVIYGSRCDTSICRSQQIDIPLDLIAVKCVHRVGWGRREGEVRGMGNGLGGGGVG